MSTVSERESRLLLPARSIAAISKPCTPSSKSYGFQPDSQAIVERSPSGKTWVHSNRAVASGEVNW